MDSQRIQNIQHKIKTKKLKVKKEILKMAKFYDISSKITNELPTLKITEDIIVTINNRTKTIMNVEAMYKELLDRKEDNQISEYDVMKKALKMLIGAKKEEEIDKLQLPIDEYKEVFTTIFSIATGQYNPDTPNEQQ
jgi:hypothetical protein